MKKFAVILNGSGHRDGSEIHEAVLTLLSIEEAGATWECVALNRNQDVVINHVSGKVVPGAERNMLEEAARIARGRIKDLQKVSAASYDAVIIPGGSGTARNLCNFATAGANMTVVPEVAEFLLAAHKAGKPIGAVCIAPMIIAKVFGGQGVTLTLGAHDVQAEDAARAMGAKHLTCKVSECVVDERMKIVTTPAYMCDTDITGVARGIRQMIQSILKMS